jgi:hypothetical protein
MVNRWLSAGGSEGDLQKLRLSTIGVVTCQYGATRAVYRELAACDTISPWLT